MKELTIEEKAKRYDEAIERAREFVSKDNVEVSEYIFPELAEYEDERIRKAIICGMNAFKDQKKETFAFIPIDDCIAWLEKQGESDETKAKMFLMNKGYPIDANGTFPTYDEIYNIIRDGIEQQSEQEEPQVYETEEGEVITYSETEGYKFVEPEFKVGNWYQCTKDFFGKGVTFDKNTAYYCAKEGCLQNEYGCHIAIVKDLYDNFKLWDISDAKDGDVLFCKGNIKNSNGIKYERICLFNNLDNAFFTLTRTSNYEEYDIDVNVDYPDNTVPATKEQKEILFMAMADAGYTFDFERKELKKTNEDFNGEDYGIDSFFHAQRILEKTLGKVNGYQTDDGILAHKCAITAVNKIYKQKSAWSEEDENQCINTIELVKNANDCAGILDKEAALNWLKSLKERVYLNANN